VTAATLKSLFKQNVLTRIGPMNLKTITLDPLQRVLNEMAQEHSSRSQLQKIRTHLKAMLEYAVDEKMIPSNPARGKKLTMPTKGVKKQSERYYSLEEVHKLIAKATGREHVILRLFFVAGLRPGELFALRVNDIRPGEILVDEALKQAEKGKERLGDPKTPGSENAVPIPQSLEQEVRMWIESQCLRKDDFIFRSKVGTPMDPKNYLQRVLRNAMVDDAKKPLVEDLDYRAMRRTCATYFRANLKAAQRQLRHSTPMTTAKIYQKTITEEQRAAVEALDAELCPATISKTCELVVSQRKEDEAPSGLVN